MKRNCGSCGEEFDTERSTAKWCSPNCNKRGQRGHITPVPDHPGPPDPSEGRVTTAMRKSLVDAGRLESVLGQNCLTLAARLDSNQDTGAGMASLSKELRASFEAATANASREVNPIDKLRLVVGERLGGS